MGDCVSLLFERAGDGAARVSATIVNEPKHRRHVDNDVPRARLTALLPAHDEAANITAALDSLERQTVPPDEVIVIADNCTDDTAAVARAHGARVVETVGNRHKKAGALNQALGDLLPHGADRDLVLVMDADSLLDENFLAAARTRLEGPLSGRLDRRGRPLGGVGGTFRGGPGGGLVGTFQRNEYTRYARDVRRRKGKALVLTGTASVFPAGVLREVQQARRDGWLPDRSGAGNVYDVHVLTEDNELSLALMHLGYGILAPADCTLQTEVMTSWRDLARQRLRWKRGALENVVDYGFTRVTAAYWGRQALSALGVLITLLYLLTLASGVLMGMHVHPFWLGASAVFSIERVVTVRRRGWQQMVLAAPLVIEFFYDVFLQAVQGWALIQAVLKQERKW